MIRELLTLTSPVILTIIGLLFVGQYLYAALVSWLFQLFMVIVFTKNLSGRLIPWKPHDVGPYRIPIGKGKVWWIVRKAVIDFKQAPSWQIQGTPGYGKSSLLIGIVLWCVLVGEKYRIKTYVLDGKMTGDFAFVEAANNGEYVADEPHEFLKWSRTVRKIVEERYLTRNQASKNLLHGIETKIEDQPVILLIDEVVAAGQILKAAERKEFFENIDYIISQGRQAEVFMIWATQRSDANDVGGGRVRDNTGGKIALGPQTATMANMIMRGHLKELLRIPAKPGHGLMVVGSATPMKIRTYHAESPSDPNIPGTQRAKLLAQFGDVAGNLKNSEHYHSRAA